MPTDRQGKLQPLLTIVLNSACYPVKRSIARGKPSIPYMFNLYLVGYKKGVEISWKRMNFMLLMKSIGKVKVY
jgi:hypothetical protein